MRPYYSPLPKITDLIKASAFSGLLNSQCLPHNVQWYSLGRWAMAAGVKTFGQSGGVLHVWLPDYICGEVPETLTKIGANILYYPVNRQLQPDWMWLEQARDKKKGQIFIIVHYFGIVNDLVKARSFCDQEGLFLLEDATHCLPTYENVRDFQGDAIVFSPRKTLPLPDCGILITKSVSGTDFYDGRLANSGKKTFVWFLKNLLKRLILMARVDPAAMKKIQGPLYGNGYNEGTSTERPSSISVRLFCHYMSMSRRISEVRRDNYMLWHEIFDSVDGMEPLYSGLRGNETPQVFPLFVQREQGLIISNLKKSGVPAGVWPDLPPEIMIIRNEHENAFHLRKHIVLLPVHQDLNSGQIKNMASKIECILKRK